MSRTPPADDEYTVIGCSNCDHLQIVKGAPETTECQRCGTRMTFKKRKQFYRTDSREAAQNARALKLAQRNGEGERFKELLQAGDLDIEDARAVTDAEFLAQQGLDPDLATDDDGAPSPVEAVERIVDERGRMARQPLIEAAVDEYGLSEAAVEEAVDRLRERGDLIRQADGTLRFL